MIRNRIAQLFAVGLAVFVSTSLAAQEPQGAVSGSAALMRGLDKVNGRTVDVDIPIGGTAEVLGLLVTLTDCRYVTVRSPKDGQVYFEGWMISSSPALNALDHNRYDVWVIRCKSE